MHQKRLGTTGVQGLFLGFKCLGFISRVQVWQWLQNRPWIFKLRQAKHICSHFHSSKRASLSFKWHGSRSLRVIRYEQLCQRFLVRLSPCRLSFFFFTFLRLRCYLQGLMLGQRQLRVRLALGQGQVSISQGQCQLSVRLGLGQQQVRVYVSLGQC